MARRVRLTMSDDDRHVEYIPPSRDTILEYSKAVCEAMGITDLDTRWGLANFLQIVAKAEAQILTKKANDKLEGSDNE